MLLGAVAGALCAILPAIWMWGFTVDDAFVSIRYARHLAGGAGYQFNPGGPPTDGVTPLPWALLLVPLAGAGALDVLMRVKYMGLALWAATGASLGAAVARGPATWAAKGVALAALALGAATGAHAVSGMETSLATTAATFAALSAARPRRAAAFAGLAAALRPEMAPWALALGVGFGLTDARRARGAVVGALLALGPFTVCAMVRLAVFGRPAPLAVLAKPSDLTHGAAYAAAAALVTGGPLLALAPRALARAPFAARTLAVAGLVHLCAVAAAGGDWMPFARLIVPIAPSLVYASVLIAPHTSRWAFSARAALALGLEGYVAVHAAPAGRHVLEDRRALVHAAMPFLAGARRVASVDAGWPSAATDATIVDLAGVTDPQIAALPGGHTSKRVSAAFLLARDPDVVLLYADADVDAEHLAGWQGAHYPRALEARLARDDLIASHFEPRGFLPLGHGGPGYVLLARATGSAGREEREGRQGRLPR